MKYEKDFAVVFNFNEKNIYYMPKDKIQGPLPEPGEALKLYSPGKFYVDTTAIYTNPNELESFFNECSIAK